MTVKLNPRYHDALWYSMLTIKDVEIQNPDFITLAENRAHQFWTFVWGKNATTKKMSTWWRHQMETVSALLVICAGNSPVPGEFPAQRPVTRGFDVFFDLRPNKPLSKQLWSWWFETPSHSLWRHRNEVLLYTGRSFWRDVSHVRIKATQMTSNSTVCCTACSV